MKSEQEALATELNEEINNLKSANDQLRNDKDIEINKLNEQIKSREVSFKEEINSKDDVISQVEANCDGLKSVLEELQMLRAKEKEDMELMMSEKDSEKQVRVAVVDCRMTLFNVVSVSRSVLCVFLLNHNFTPFLLRDVFVLCIIVIHIKHDILHTLFGLLKSK